MYHVYKAKGYHHAYFQTIEVARKAMQQLVDSGNEGAFIEYVGTAVEQFKPQVDMYPEKAAAEHQSEIEALRTRHNELCDMLEAGEPMSNDEVRELDQLSAFLFADMYQ